MREGCSAVAEVHSRIGAGAPPLNHGANHESGPMRGRMVSSSGPLTNPLTNELLGTSFSSVRRIASFGSFRLVRAPRTSVRLLRRGSPRERIVVSSIVPPDGQRGTQDGRPPAKRGRTDLGVGPDARRWVPAPRGCGPILGPPARNPKTAPPGAWNGRPGGAPRRDGPLCDAKSTRR
jgi:hypothetical protein